MQQMMEKSAAMNEDTDYFNLTMSLYNVPMSDGSKQAVSFYFDRSPYDDTMDLKDQLQPLMNELAALLVRSKPTTDPSDLCVFATWGGRMHADDGTFIGAEILAQMPVTYGDGSFVSGGSVYYVSDGRITYSRASGSISAFNPCYRAFSAQDETRLIEILHQWQAISSEYNMARYGTQTDGAATIGKDVVDPLVSTAPVG